MKSFKINHEKEVYSGFLKVLKANVQYDKHNNEGEIKASRECLERGDSTAVLLHNIDNNSFLFTRQFRYPSARRKDPWMLELVAGSIDEDESAEQSAIRETREEVGYDIHDLEPISTYYPSPGGCSEQIHLFYARIRDHQKKYIGGGKANEKEDIELVSIKVFEAKEMLRSGAFNNSIILISLQWYFLQQV